MVELCIKHNFYLSGIRDRNINGVFNTANTTQRSPENAAVYNRLYIWLDVPQHITFNIIFT
jgi:hypothetical protein